MAQRPNRSKQGGGTATANRPRPPANNNPAIEPQPDVVRVPEVLVVSTPDFQVDASAITMLDDDPDDPTGLRVDDFDPDEPVFDMTGRIEGGMGNVQDLAPNRGDTATSGFLSTDKTTYVHSGSDFDDLEDDDPLEESDVLAAAKRMMAEAQRISANADATMAAARQMVEEARTGVSLTPVSQQLPAAQPRNVAVVQSESPVIVAAQPEATRIIRPNCDVGPVFHGQEEIHLIKGRRYRVPEHIYQYLLVRDLIWSLS